MFQAKPKLLQDAVFDGAEYLLRFPFNDALKPFFATHKLRYIGAKDHPYYRWYRCAAGKVGDLIDTLPEIQRATAFAYSETPASFDSKIKTAFSSPNHKALLSGVQITLYQVVDEPPSTAKDQEKAKKKNPPSDRIPERLVVGGDSATEQVSQLLEDEDEDEAEVPSSRHQIAAAFPFHAGLNALCKRMNGMYMPSIKGFLLKGTTVAAFKMQIERDLRVPEEQITLMDGEFDLHDPHAGLAVNTGPGFLGTCLKPAAIGSGERRVKEDDSRSLLAKVPLRRAGPVTPSELEAALARFDMDEYQKVGVRHLLKYSSSLLADDMGLGKTRQAVVAAEIGRRGGQVLVVVPASVVLNWRREIQMVLPQAIVSILDYDPKAQWIVTTYGQVLKLLDHAKKFRVMICDEAHLLKSPVSRRTHDTFAVAQYIDSRMVLTGTPVMNTEAEIHTLLRISGHPFGEMSLEDFRDNFGRVRENRLKLNAEIKNWLLRRDKSLVLKLEGKTRKVYPYVLQPSAMEAYRNIHADTSLLAFVKLTMLRQALELGKVPVAIKLAKTLPANDKLIVFAEYTETVDRVINLLEAAGIGCVSYTGSMSKTVRQRAVDTFQSDETCKVFVGTSGAAGVGITLVAANWVLFLGRPWTQAILEQAEDRAYRRGQTKPVTVMVPTVDSTIDVTLSKILETKRDLSEEVVKGQVMAALKNDSAAQLAA